TSGMGLVLGGRARVVLTGHADASWVDDLATQRLSQGYTFSLGSGSVSWQSTRSSSVLSSSCEAEIYAGAMAAQELRWLTYLLIDLGEAPRSPPVMYVDNKAMLALCQDHRLEHRTKHIALRYFLARELQQRGQFRLAYVASQANTADVFTKALQPCDHQRFCTVLALPFLTGLVTSCSPPLCLRGTHPWRTRRCLCFTPRLHSLQPPLIYLCRHYVAALRLSSRPPPPPSSPCSRGGEGMGVAGVGVLGSVLPFPSSSFCSHCCSCRWGGGCEGVGELGEWHWDGGCETIQQPSLHLSSLPPLLLLQQCGGEGEGKGEEMEGVTRQSQPASSLSLLPLLWLGGRG
ncbi:unnamed protein product, partial [Closterium sp. NIES-53]